MAAKEYDPENSPHLSAQSKKKVYTIPPTPHWRATLCSPDKGRVIAFSCVPTADSTRLQWRVHIQPLH